MSNPSPLESFFFAALEKRSSAERTAFLDEACAGNSELRGSVERMLAAQAEAGSFLERPAPLPDETIDRPGREQPGGIIGPYKLLEQIGEGGMGVVYMAEQQEPVRRKVALKLIKLGMDTRQVIARFEAERQALAVMDHPSIARVLDAGVTDSGRPYFVMELVRGVPITTFCDENNLPVRERLELFAAVCQAIQHAHTKGIIHRDIKPTNVLVTRQDGTPVVKVIDFGVAKAMGQQLTEKTLFTNVAQMIGTPLYMSPEQAEQSSVDIDTRSDIYSLGVLLYELLTGSTPVDKEQMKQAAFDEIRRIIREDGPQTPSQRISGSHTLPAIAAHRHIEPARLSKLVRGELDWIVMKALEKNRNRRYETASGFAADLQRYLNDEPVLACPPSAWYRFRKFARRNKRALVTAALLSVMLVVAVGAVAGSIGWIMRSRAAQTAQFEHDLDLVVRDASPLGDKIAELVAKPTDWKTELAARLTAVMRAEALLAANTELATPDLRDRVREIRARVDAEEKDHRLVTRLEDLGLPQDSVRSGVLLPDPTEMLPEIARAFREYGIPVGMDAKQAGDMISRRPVPIRDLVVAGLDTWMARNARQSELDWLRAVVQAADNDTWRNEVRQASAKGERGKLEELSRTVDVSKQPAQSLVLLGRALESPQSLPSALELLRRAQRYYRDDFWVNFQVAYYSVLVQPPQFNLAARYFSVAAALRPHNRIVLQYLASPLNNTGDYDGAIATLREILALKPDYASAYAGLGYAFRGKGNVSAAISAYQKAVDLDIDDEAVVIALVDLLKAKGDRAGAAAAAYHEAIKFQPDDPQFHNQLVDLAAETGDLEGAIATYQKLITLRPKSVHYYGLGNALQQNGDLTGARSACRKAVAERPTSPRLLHLIGNLCEDLGDLPTAIAGYLAAVEVAPDYEHRANMHQRAGLCLKRQGKLAEAIAALRKAHELATERRDTDLGPDWALKQVRDCELLIEREGKLPAILRGELQPASSAERIDLARLCAFQELYGVSARLYEEAFQAVPQLAGSPYAGQRWSYWDAHRYHAACSAALAGTAMGDDNPPLDEPSRARWRRQAVAWLRSDLAVLAPKSRKGDDVVLARMTLDYWQHDESLEGVRDLQKIAKLPAEEADDCRALWSDVQQTRQALRQVMIIGTKKSAPENP